MVAIKTGKKPRTVGMPKPTTPHKRYWKVGDGWIDMNFYADGQPVRLTDAAAKYQKLRGAITDKDPVEAAPAPAPSQAPAPAPVKAKKPSE